MRPLAMGRIASFYYMRHQTMATFAQALGPGMDVQVRPACMPAFLKRKQPCCRKELPCKQPLHRWHHPHAFCLHWVARHASTHARLPLHPPMLPMQSLLPVLCAAAEYDELPVRHNEDKLNVVLNQSVRWPVDSRTAGAGGAQGLPAPPLHAPVPGGV